MNLTVHVLGLICLMLAAGPANSVTTAESAQLVVSNTTNRMLAVLEREREEIRREPGRIYELVDEIILPHFDFSRMSRWVLGKRYWQGASPAQREQFIHEFRTLLIRTYATALLEYSEQTVEFLPLKAKPDATQVLVRTEVRQPGAFPIPINYRMYLRDGRWRVFDVTIDGISLVENYRGSFAAELRRSGLADLIAMLAEKNQEAQ
jgi:phospholipid transport system substrate-binding protein